MTITKQELGHRLRAAREAANLTQEMAAAELDISRPTMSQIEAGGRAITSIELDRLAYIYGRNIGDFFDEKFVQKEDPLAAMFRAHEGMVEDPKVHAHLQESLAIAREHSQLENLLGIDHTFSVATYPMPEPSKKWTAIKQGEQVAVDERKRLGLGYSPIGNLTQLLENQGIRLRLASLTQDISGFTMYTPETGPVIVINLSHPKSRRRYSLAHEYGHVLMDRGANGIISLRSERADLCEVRANSFGAAFLMPEDGIKQYLTLLGKDRIPRSHSEIFDGDETVSVEFRATADQKINLLDVVQLANHFGVSSEAILYRLLNMRLISPTEREELQNLDEQKGESLREPLHLKNEITEMDNYIDQRLIALAAEALQREEISTGYFKQLLRRIKVTENNIDKILRNIEGGK